MRNLRRNVSWDFDAWTDYLAWLEQDRTIFQRINLLIGECLRTPFIGTGKPEPLRHQYQGYWSRRITAEHRLVYRVTDEEIRLVSCRYHYQQGKK